MAKRRQRKRQLLPIRSGDEVTKERCNQFGGVVTEIVDRDAHDRVYMLRYHARIECTLDAYLLKTLITKQEHKVGMRYRMAWLRARCGIKVADRFSSGRVVSYENSLTVIPESERILKEADAILTAAQKRMVVRVCCDDKLAGGTDSLETLRRGLHGMAKNWG